MNKILKQAFLHEMNVAKKYYKSNDLKNCFYHLERAHVLGQRNAITHTINHWWMFKVGIRRKDFREILGQIARMAIGGIGSVFNLAPVGNTGGANVWIFRPMPIPEDLHKIFREAGMD